MTIECASCGSIEVSDDNYQSIINLPEDHWQFKYLRDSIVGVKGPAMISKNNVDVFQVEPLKTKLTKLNKWSLRRKAEDKSQVIGHIFYTGNDEKEGT